MTLGIISGPSVRNQEDTGQRDKGQFIHHHHLYHSWNILFCIDVLVTNFHFKTIINGTRSVIDPIRIYFLCLAWYKISMFSL